MFRNSRLIRLLHLQGATSCQSSIFFFISFITTAAILSSRWVHMRSDTAILILHSTNQRQTCATNYSREVTTNHVDTLSNTKTCPEYFRFIHEDLKPWKARGITRAMVEKAKKTAHFRLVIIEGEVYVERYKKSIQTRDVFTIWGIMQLLRRYPGKLPDLELMFDCADRPVIVDHWWKPTWQLPPLFRYCGDRWTKDIVFPDWSFWGCLLIDIKKGNKRSKWMERKPCAYWKGNPFVAPRRKDLLKCNVSDAQGWNARLFIQDWILESQQGFKKSDVANQCTHRYKIYIEGTAWCVSEKYILTCDSVTLLVKPNYYDFFTKSLKPTHHYWPIRSDHKCKSIKFAVVWGNSHKQLAQAIGKAGSDFIEEELKMDYVYDYMFHILNEYAKLSKFEPRVPKGAKLMCTETLDFHADDEFEKKLMTESLVKSPSMTDPCAMPPPC